MADTSISVPRGESQMPPASFYKTLQDQQVGLTQAPFKLLPLRWDLEQMSFCICPLRMETRFPTASSSPKHNPTSFQSQKLFECSSSQCRATRLGSPMWDLDPSLLREDLHGWDFPLAYGSPCQECESWLEGHVSATPNCQVVVLSLYFQLC